jgi:hypothetical protein
MAGVHPSTFQSSVYSTKLAIKIVRSLVFGCDLENERELF